MHNGIIENFKPLRDELIAEGRKFESETDTEVVGHLVAREIESGASPQDAVAAVLPRLTGAFAIAFLFRDHPDLIIGARMGAPLTVGYGDGENYLGSDALAVAPWTQRIAYLDEGDWAVVRRESIQIFDRDNQPVEREIVESGASSAPVEKGNYAHYMQKEIFEQPIVVAQTLQSYVRPFEGEVALPVADADLESVNRLTIVACGTSYYAGLVAKYWVEQFARVPVDIDVASEFRYREPVLEPGGLALVHQPVGRDRRHARRAAPRAGAEAAHRGGRQRADQLDGARGGPAPADACRPRDRSRLDQGLHLPARSARGARRQSRARQGPAQPRRGEGDRRAICRRRRPRSITALGHDDDIAAMAHLIAPARDVLYLGRGPGLSDGARRRAEAQGNQLHPRRRLCRGRDEARPDRADRRRRAGDRHRAVRAAVREDRQQHAGGARARRQDRADQRRQGDRRSRRGLHRDDRNARRCTR